MLDRVGWTMVLVFAGCAGPTVRAERSPSVAASTAELEARSGIPCRSETDCAVCYRAGTCGVPIASTDPEVEAPSCHVPPAAFCMPRRARCENQRCVAR